MFNPIQPMKEIDMIKQHGSTSLRTALEQAFAGLVFAAVAALVVGGTIAMCLPSATLLA